MHGLPAISPTGCKQYRAMCGIVARFAPVHRAGVPANAWSHHCTRIVATARGKSGAFGPVRRPDCRFPCRAPIAAFPVRGKARLAKTGSHPARGYYRSDKRATRPGEHFGKPGHISRSVSLPHRETDQSLPPSGPPAHGVSMKSDGRGVLLRAGLRLTKGCSLPDFAERS